MNLTRAAMNRWRPVARRVSVDPTPVRRLTIITVLCLMLAVAVRGSDSSPATGDWPQWRGPGRDGISLDTGLLKSWPTGGPPVLWIAKDLGKGSGQPSIANGRVFCLGYDGTGETLCALDEKAGEVLWSQRISQKLNGQMLIYGSCSTPTVDGDRVYALAGFGVLACLEATTGRILWQRNLPSDFAGGLHEYGYCESPLVDGDKVLVTPGSASATVVALNKHDGTTIWRCPAPKGNGDQLSSIVAMTVGGRRFYVQSTGAGMSGMAPENGAIIWSSEERVYLSTAICEGNRMLLQSCLINLSNVADRITSQIVYHNVPLDDSYGGGVLVDGYVYSTRNQGMSCSELATGKLQWCRPAMASRPTRESVAYADGRVYFRDDGGSVFLFEANPQRPVECGHFQDNVSSHYAPPAIANRRLYLRGDERLCCYDLATKGSSPLEFQKYVCPPEGERLQLRISRSDGLPLNQDRATQTEILTATDLNGSPNRWTLLTNQPVLTNGALTITVSRDLSEPARYYRVRERD